MSQLSPWLQEHRDQLIEAVANRLTTSERFRSTANITAVEFLDAFIAAIEQSTVLQLDDWVRPRLNPLSPDESLLSILMDIQDLFEEVIQGSDEDVPDMLIESQKIFRQAALHLAQKELQFHVKNLQGELDRIRENTMLLEKHKADFVSVAAHELKTPLTLIEGYAHMLKSDFPSEDYPRAAAMMKGILSGTQRLREIIEDMIDTSVIEMRMIEINLQPVWLDRLINIVITEMADTAAEREITITFHNETLPKESLMGDPERLFQVFKKIVENAIKFTPNGGKISISGRKTPEGMAEILIRDTGIGLDTKDQEVIFEKFYSLGQVGLHSSSKSKFKGGGSGLGLAIARGIVEAHGGKIWVESEGHDEQNFKGSCFHILLPMESRSDTNMVSSDNTSTAKGVLDSEVSNHPALAYPVDITEKTESDKATN